MPTRNEAPNVAPLVARLARVLGGLHSWEAVFVDDSDDSTASEVRRAARWAPVRLHHRPPGRRRGGLGGAVVDGFSLARGEVLVVMDADLQHPPEVVPDLVQPILSGWADLVAGTRYQQPGAPAGLVGPWRRGVSVAARWAVYGLVPGSRCLSDPMSGLFALAPAAIEGVTLRPNGFKILLEIAARGRASAVHNLAYQFAERQAGHSKARAGEGLRFAAHLARLVADRGLVGPPAEQRLPLLLPAGHGPRQVGEPVEVGGD